MSLTNFFEIRSKAAGITTAHAWHFFALSELFLLPLSVSLVYGLPILKTLLRQSHPDQLPPSLNMKTLILALTCIVFISFFSLCAVRSISYSVFHGFHGRSVKLTSSIKWILSPKFSFLTTTMVSVVVMSVLLVLLAIFSFLTVEIVKMASGIDRFDNSSLYFNLVSLVIWILLLIFLLYFHVNRVLPSLIVEMESSRGFRPVERSTNLESLALYFLLFDTLFIGNSIFLADHIWMSTGPTGDARNWWRSLASLLWIVLSPHTAMMFFLYNIAANTVLYIYRHNSGVHGENAMESDEEITEEYVSLPPVDQDKVPHLVSVA